MEQEHLATERRPMVSGIAGVVMGSAAGAVMVLFTVALRFATGTAVLPEVVADWLTRVMPPAVFDFLLGRLQVAAKPLLFVGVLMGQVVLGGGLGLLHARYAGRLPFKEGQPWRRGLLIASALWLAAMVVVTPVLGGGFFGASLLGGSWPYFATTFLVLAAFGLSLSHLHALAVGRGDRLAPSGRRRFLQMVGFFALLAAGGAFAVRYIARGVSTVSPTRVFQSAGELPPEVTPNETFYEVSKNIVNPRLDAATWKLQLAGNVGNPYSLTYEELQALPWKEEYVTLTCISNPVGGDLISNALWRGVSLKLLLERAQLPPSAQRLAFRAADGYVDSFSVERATRENVLVAYLMNGEPLPFDHGFPARLIVPGLYGMENVKWLTKIEPVIADFRGYWQQRGWADTAVIKTMSRVDVPVARVAIPLSETAVGGVAFAGDRGVTRVEVSTDGGSSWQPAELRKALSPYTWVLWTRAWTPASVGRYTIAARATDGTGQVQSFVVQDSLPDGATGYHRVMVSVQGP